jgi:hypothetical protein
MGSPPPLSNLGSQEQATYIVNQFPPQPRRLPSRFCLIGNVDLQALNKPECPLFQQRKLITIDLLPASPTSWAFKWFWNLNRLKVKQ